MAQLHEADPKLRAQFDAVNMAEFLQALDNSGCDYGLKDETQMRGLAVRVQQSRTANRIYRTVTLRVGRTDKRTGKPVPKERIEVHKRYYAYLHPQESYITPALTIHAYVDVMGGLLRVGVARTWDLCALIERKGGPLGAWARRRYVELRDGDEPGNAWFIPIGFNEVPMVLVIDHFGDALLEVRRLIAKGIDVSAAARSVQLARKWSVRAALQLIEHIKHDYE
jgi:hypothetical protein